jgi:STE24 endopeptidase
MYLYVLIGFALLMGVRDWPFAPFIVGLGPAIAAAVLLIAILALLGTWGSSAALRRLRADPSRPYLAQHLHHRATLGLRVLLLGGFAAVLYLTDWGALTMGPGQGALSRMGGPLGDLPGIAQFVAALPFVLGLIVIWLVQFPIDRALRAVAIGHRAWEAPVPQRVWTLGEYLVFNLRHQLLVIAVPMLLIMIAFDLVRRYEEKLRQVLGVTWGPDAVLASASAAVFIFAPVLLRYIWPTSRLPDGELRRRLDVLCRRLGLRYRDILIWHSGGMMVNAAVMGLFAPVRYVLLSDGLLDSMDIERIEAVFGHEAGHVRHRHIQYFVLFALASMFVVGAFVNALAYLSSGPDRLLRLSEWNIEAAGVVCAILIWGLAFGWISRRFERQADVFGAHCVTPASPEHCLVPCGVHNEGGPTVMPVSLCSTGAMIFASALERVARLNGIPIDERSWRHSSIASRCRFLTRLASDPLAALRFDRLIQCIKLVLLGVVLLGAIGSGYAYFQPAPAPRYEARWVPPARMSRPANDAR